MYFRASTPEAYGGFGEHSSITGVLAAEEMAWGDLAGTLAVMVPGLFAIPILLSGNEEQKNKYLPPIVEGDWSPYTTALIEQQYDYDPNDLRTTATIDGDFVILNGEKAFVPFAERVENNACIRIVEWKDTGFYRSQQPSGFANRRTAKITWD